MASTRADASADEGHQLPQGKVVVSVYSSGAIAGLAPEAVAGLVRYPREHAAASA
jgi:hypothetical protein